MRLLKEKSLQLGVCFFVSVSYFAIILKIAPYQVDRYVFGIYPELTLLMFYFVFKIVNYWGSKNTAFATALIMAAVFFHIWSKRKARNSTCIKTM